MRVGSSSLLAKVQNCISDLIIECTHGPLDHFSEKSLQVRLAAKLLNVPEMKEPVETGILGVYRKHVELIQMEENRRCDLARA